MELAWYDWMVIGTMLAISAGMGIYCGFIGDQHKTAEEYFFANRSVGVLVLSYTMMIACISEISMLASVRGNYTIGVLFNTMYLGTILGTPIVSYCYLPVFYRLNIMSVYEYLERRFGVTTRLMTGIACFIVLNFYMGIMIYVPALTLRSITGLNDIASILLIGLICIFYSSIGGMKAIILTDVVQGLQMFICMCSVIGTALNELDGGIWSIFDAVQKGGRLQFNFDFDPTIQYTWWSLSIGGTFFFLSSFGCGQVEVQRLLTAKSLGDARKVLWMHIPLNLLMAAVFCFAGLVLYTHYAHCDPVTAGKIRSYDMVMPYFAKNRMTRIPGLIGIFVVGIYSGSLSSASAMLNSLTAIALADFIKPLYGLLGRELIADKVVFYGRTLGVIIGFVSLSVAILASTFGNIIQAVILINGAVSGPILGLFTLGMFTEFANETGAICGMIAAIVGNLFWVFSPKPITPVLPMSLDGCPNATNSHQHYIKLINDPSSYSYINRLSYLWISLLGMTIAIIIGTVVSVIVEKCSKTSPRILDVNLFTPILAARIKRRRENEAKCNQHFVLNTRNS